MKFLLAVSYLSLAFQVHAQSNPDSVQRVRGVWVLTPRFNTLNMAPVSGSIVNRHVNIDLTLLYSRNRFMWTCVNGLDLEDQHSEMNYFLTNVRYRINLTRQFSVSPFLAFYSEHTHQLIDPISDANGGMIFSFQKGGFAIEAFVLMVRLTHPQSMKDIINRFEMRYKIQNVSLSAFVYQNTQYFDNKRRLALGFRITMPEFKIFYKANVRTEITGSYKIYENPETKNLSGTFLSMAFPMRSHHREPK